MKKILLMSAMGFLALGANAQYKKAADLIYPTLSPKLQHKFNNVTPSQTAQRPTATTERWYSNVENLGDVSLISKADMYSGDHASFLTLWQDTALVYEAGGAHFGWLAVGEIFQPSQTLYTDPQLPSNAGKQMIASNKSYKVDSIKAIGWYNRTDNSVTDTLLFTVNTGALLDGWFVSGSAAIDTFKVMLWNVDSINNRYFTQQVPYNGSNRVLQIKVPLNDAVFADSSEVEGVSGLSVHQISIPANITVGGGQYMTVSVNFVSGATYNFGDVIDDYNYFSILSHTTGFIDPSTGSDDGHVSYPPRNKNLSYLVTKSYDSATTNSGLMWYNPTAGYTDPLPYEIHNIQFKITCTDCPPVSVADVASSLGSVEVYPNPANNTVSVPFTLVANTNNVEVSLTNVLGQKVAAQTFAKVTANTRNIAEFNTSGLPNGVYIYTLSANGQKLTGKVVVSH